MERSIWGRKALDAIIYAVAVTAIVVVVSIAISFALSGGWTGVKLILFIVGFGLFGIATFKLYPTAAWRESDRNGSGSESGNKNSELVQTDRDNESRLQQAIHRVPPLDQYRLHPDERLSIGVKLFLASVLILLVSFLMESVFGVIQ